MRSNTLPLGTYSVPMISVRIRTMPKISRLDLIILGVDTSTAPAGSGAARSGGAADGTAPGRADRPRSAAAS